MTTKLLLVTGPPGVGKTTVIKHLCMLDERFDYVTPYTTRSLRSGEVDKIFVSEAEMSRLWNTGELVAMNELYGVRYGTPRRLIETAFERERFPVIDWPITHVHILEAQYPQRIIVVYLKPPDRAELVRRLTRRDQTDDRIAEACEEWERLEAHEFDGLVGAIVINRHTDEAAALIYQLYLSSLNGRTRSNEY